VNIVGPGAQLALRIALGEQLEAGKELVQVVLALRVAGRLAGLVDRGQEHRREDTDDRDHDQQLHERERMTLHVDSH
jgi:hypothetical protein